MNYLISLCCGALFFLQSLTVIAATYTVTNTANAGAGSFRNAVAAAGNGDLIQFAIAGAAPHVITLTAVIAITQNNLTIDASTQSDYTCGNPTVVIDLGGAWPCTFTVQGTGNTIRGISFRSVLFAFNGGGAHQLQGCWFNLNTAGTGVAGNNMGASLMTFTNSTGNTIGGTTCATRNVFSMGGATYTYQGAILLNTGCHNNVFRGNYIGTDKTGMVLLNQNSDHMLWINNSIDITIDQNVISGARPIGAIGGFGVFTNGASTNGLSITNNKIGVRVDGTDGGVAWGNAYGGVAIESATCNNLVFNDNIVCRNGLVSGTDIQKCGLYILSACATVNIRNNFVGVTPSFQLAGNYFTGIFINGICSAVTINNNVIGNNGGTLGDGDESHGLSLEKPCTNVSITDNYIGTNAAGANLGNYCSGMTISGGSNYTITGNRIGFNKGARPAIPNACIVFTNTTDVLIQGNFLGGLLVGGPAGQNNLGLNIDGGSGIFISGTSSRFRIGGMGAGQQNVISYNRSHGIEVKNGDYIEMRWNSLFCNGLKAIELNYGTAQAGNNNFGNGTLSITGPVPVTPTGLTGVRPANSVVDVYGTYSCASSASCIAQGESRFTGTYVPAAAGIAGTTWSYNNGSPMFNDISALATGAGSDCNGGYCRTSEFSPCIDNPLPLTWLSFEMEKRDEEVWLYWKTAQEENTGMYVVERSKEGEEFIAIGSVPARGTSSTYHYRDEQPLPGWSYYRIREQDLDGMLFYTDMKSIFNEGSSALLLSPNPNHGKFNIRLSGFNDMITVQVHDVVGNLVYHQQVKEVSLESLSISIQGKPKGMYIVSVTDDRKTISSKMIVE